MRVGVLVTGETSVRAAHSIAAHPSVDEVVVIGPAKSKNFRIVDTADGCDLLVGSGPTAPGLARRHKTPLIWDGDESQSGVAVWGANVKGLTLALADRETDPRLVASAHPDHHDGKDQKTRFPDPVGTISISDSAYGGLRLAAGKSTNDFAACLAEGARRRVTIVDDAGFMSGVALGAAVSIAHETPGPVWAQSLAYLETATAMGLVMAEDL